jgi:hypothetical protein
LQQYKLFLAQKDFQERTDYGLLSAPPTEPHTLPRPAQFSEYRGQSSHNAMCPWRAKIEVCTTERMVLLPHPSFQHGHTSVVFRREPHNSAELSIAEISILPCFQVRAHFIDKDLDGSFYSHLQRAYLKYNASSVGEEIRDKKARLTEEDHWILPFFVDDHELASAYWDPRSAFYAPTNEASRTTCRVIIWLT